MQSRRTFSLGVALILTVSLASPVASASPTESSSFEYDLSCDGVDVGVVYQEWSRLKQFDGQEVLLVHGTRTYTVEGESLPFFRFISSYVDRFYESQDGDATSLRAGLDDSFIGHTLINERTGEEVRNGQETLEPDEQACLALTG